jgi:hypothetical protein
MTVVSRDQIHVCGLSVIGECDQVFINERRPREGKEETWCCSRKHHDRLNYVKRNVPDLLPALRPTTRKRTTTRVP